MNSHIEKDVNSPTTTTSVQQNQIRQNPTVKSSLTMNTIAKFLLFQLIASVAVAQTSTYLKTTKSLFDAGCASLCKDHVGDPVDVSGVDFADLVSLFLDGNSTNTTFGNSTEDNDAYLLYGDISCWDVSEVTDMSGAFAYQDEFTGGVECWDVAAVTDMSHMFLEASSFEQNLNAWSDKVPRDNIDTTDMFKGSGCEVQTDPDTIGRPWCQFNTPLFSPEFQCFFFKKC